MKNLQMYLIALLLIGIGMPSSSYAQRVKKRKTVKVVKTKKRRHPNRVGKKPKYRTVKVLSPRAKVITHNNKAYHFNDGIFYSNNNNVYRFVFPPRGIRVGALPSNRFAFRHGGMRYYYYSGVYYHVISEDTFEVVDAPINTIVPDLPEEAVQVEKDGAVYYQADNVIYQEIKVNEMKRYKVVEVE